MRKNLVHLFALMSWVTITLSAEDIVNPERVPDDLVPTPPFSYNGMIRVTTPLAYGSGSMVGQGVMATAAHVVYNESIYHWIAPSLIQYYPQSDSNNVFFGRTRYTPVALYRWDDYSSRVRDDVSGEGYSSPETFNMDIAVGYFSVAIDDPMINEHAEAHIDAIGDVTIHRHPREKMIVGYPQDSDYIPFEDRGKMHLTAPGDYYAQESIENEDMPGFDFGGVWASANYYYYVTTHGGGSGGPVYVRDDMNNWMMAGVAVGGTESSLSIVRSIDENAWSGIEQEGMIQQAVIARNGNAMRRVEDLQAGADTGTVNLQWTDLSTRESGYYVFRQINGIYEQIATLPENTTSYLDETVEPGMVYHYQVQPFRVLSSTGHFNKAPKSPQLAVDVPGRNIEAGDFLNNPLLKLSSSGKSSWYVDADNRYRAGLVRPLSSSSLFLDIIGPGTVTFDWSASCEVNEDYTNNNPNDPDRIYFGLVYDAIWLYLNGSTVEDDGTPVFLSGPVPDHPTGILSETGIALTIPEGPQRIEWRYEKDPYTDDHQDTAFLDALAWEPDPVDPYPVYAAYQVENTDWHASEWFGWYETGHWPWLAHENLGWLYMIGGSAEKGTLFHLNHPDLGYLYTSPDYWPYCYLPLNDTWCYFFADTGIFGESAYFYHFEKQRILHLGAQAN